MSDNNSSNYENKLNELREAQNRSEAQHHIDTKDILYITTKTKALVTTIACFATVLVAVAIAAGCGVSVAATKEAELVSVELRDQNLRRVIERALWLESNVGFETAGGVVITTELVKRDAHRVIEHKQFRLDFPFKHPSFKGWKLLHLIERADGVFGCELRRLLSNESD